MTRSTMKCVKGLGVGMLLGAAVGVVGCCYMKHHRKGIKHNLHKALRHMSDLAESMNGMF